MKTVYLAGPMENVSKEEQSSWRQYVKSYLVDKGWNVLDPCRRCHDKEDMDNKRIFELDLQDIRQSQLVIADLRRGDREAHGTAMEVFYAYYDRRIPVIGWAIKDQRKHPFLEACVTEWFTDLDKMNRIIKRFY